MREAGTMSTDTSDSCSRSCWICYSTDPFSSYYHPADDAFVSLGHHESLWYHILSWISRASSTQGMSLSKDNVDTCKNEWVQPCPCKGSMQWVHQSCLLAWTKVQLSNLQRSSFTQVVTDEVSREYWWNRIWPLSSFGSSSRVSYYTHGQLCCPQCKTPYKFQEVPTGIVLASLEAMERLTGRALVFISASGVALSIYTLMWVYGYFALRCLMGGEDMYQLMTPLHHHIPWIDDYDIAQYSNSDWMRQAMFICSAIPAFPISLFISSNPTFSRLGPFLLHYFAHLYYPNVSDTQGSSYFIMAWIIPLSWNLYKFSRIIVHSGVFSHSAFDLDDTVDDHSESQEGESLSEVLEDFSDYEGEDNDTRSQSSPIESTRSSTASRVAQSLELAPSSVRINLLSITQILCWPFASAICGRIVLFLALRSNNMLNSTTQYSKTSGIIMRIVNWVICLSPMTRNVAAGFSLAMLRDMVSNIIEHCRDKRNRSRVILSYSQSESR